jgi:hypothetical protein
MQGHNNICVRDVSVPAGDSLELDGRPSKIFKKRHVHLAFAALMTIMAGSAQAASVSYFLDQSNINISPNPLPDGINYLKVTISDGTLGNIDFKVETLAPLTSIATSGFGIDQFGFNTGKTLTSGNFVLPTNWTNIGAGNMDGFGQFGYRVDANGAANRVSILNFSITGIVGDTVYDYVNLSTGNAGQGNEYFAAHVAGFNANGTTSAFFGGSTPVPLPAAAWLFGSGLFGLIGLARRRKA